MPAPSSVGAVYDRAFSYMQRTPAVLVAALWLGLSGCGGESFEVSAPSAPTAQPVVAPVAAQTAVQDLAIPRRLVKNVDLGLEVEDSARTAESINKMATELGGHIASMTTTSQGGLLRYEITLRIPESKLEDASAVSRNSPSAWNAKVSEPKP